MKKGVTEQTQKKKQKEKVHEQEVAGKMRGGVNDQRPDDHGAKKKG